MKTHPVTVALVALHAAVGLFVAVMGAGMFWHDHIAGDHFQNLVAANDWLNWWSAAAVWPSAWAIPVITVAAFAWQAVATGRVWRNGE
jgi:hypothetical protein